MKRFIYTVVLIAAFTFLGGPVFAQNYIADYSVAKESVVRDIPEQYVNAARTGLVVAYQHTSHGTHVSRGVAGLQDYKSETKSYLVYLLLHLRQSLNSGTMPWRIMLLRELMLRI